MSAYEQGNLSTEGYLVRILAGLCKAAGGELRVKGELVDDVGGATTIITDWDSEKQELVIRAPLGKFSKVFRLTPEKQDVRQVIAPATRVPEQSPQQETLFTKSANMMDDGRSSNQEKVQARRALAALIKQGIENAKREQQL